MTRVQCTLFQLQLALWQLYKKHRMIRTGALMPL